MKTPAFATALTVSALALSSFASAEANNNVGGVLKRADGKILQRNLKIGIIPKDQLPLFKRADEPTSADNNDNNDNKDNKDSSPSSTKAESATKATSSEKNSPSPTSSAKSSSKGSGSGKSTKEEGTLENDKEEESASGKGNKHSKDNNDNSEAISGEVATDEEGNPIVTNQDATYWEMIPPTGVVYPSGASSRQYSNGVALTAIGIVAAVMLF
ncbi:hypothetical protein EC988_000053 [Linderina pennispora]|nr:hypothetical protein EC988_000053 [Linderina pennispora]